MSLPNNLVVYPKPKRVTVKDNGAIEVEWQWWRRLRTRFWYAVARWLKRPELRQHGQWTITFVYEVEW